MSQWDKEPNVNGDGKWLKAHKSSGDLQNFGVLPSGDDSVKLSNGDEILGYFFHWGRMFGHFFQLGGGPTGPVTQGCIQNILN